MPSLGTAGGRLLALHRGRLVLAWDGLLRLVALHEEEEEVMVETEGDTAAAPGHRLRLLRVAARAV